jgi:hypothetical protein
VAELLYKYSPHLIKKTYSDPSKFVNKVDVKEYMFEGASSVQQGAEKQQENSRLRENTETPADEEEKQKLNQKDISTAN